MTIKCFSSGHMMGRFRRVSVSGHTGWRLRRVIVTSASKTAVSSYHAIHDGDYTIVR